MRRILVEKSQGTRNFGDRAVDGNSIVKWALEKWDMKVQFALNLLMISSSV